MNFKTKPGKAVISFILVFTLMAGLFMPFANMPQARAAGSGPDLVVDAVTAPDTILAGREVSVTVTVYNAGDAAAEGFAVTLSAGGEEIQSKTVSSVYAGESARVLFAWTPAQPGDYVLKAVADSGGAVSEADEDNNELTKNVTVSPDWEKISNFPANADYSYIWQSPAGNVYLSVKHKDGNSKLYQYNGPDTFTELGSLPDMSMSAIGGVSDDRIYVAESTTKKIWLYNGATFEEMARENSGTVNAFWTAGSGETYAVGADGSIEKYDPAENKWKAMASPTTGYLLGIWGTGTGDIYAVGQMARVIHYDGSDWSIVYEGSGGTLRSVWGLSATDVYVCGDKGTILHFDGSSWTVMSGTGTSDTLYSIIGFARDDIYAFGGASAAVIVHFNGAAWSSVAPPSTTGKLRKAIITSNGDLLVSGYSGTLLKRSSRVPGADLAVKDIELAAGVFQPGTPAQVKVKVENRGAGEAPAGFKVKLSTADPAWEQEQAVTEAVYSGGVREVTFEWTLPQAHLVNLTALADSGGEVNEYNENNNEYTKAVAAKKLRLTTSVPQGGGRIEVSPAADEYNYGDTVRLSAVADPEYIFTEWGGDLSGSANPAAVVMDSDKQITAVFAEARNDLELADLNLNFIDPEGMQWNYLFPGRAWLVNVKVRNNGINPADGVAVDIFADGVTVGTATIDNLAPGEVKSVAVPWTPTASGSVNVRAAARHTGGVTETYTANNEKELTVDVLPSLTREAVSMNVPVVNVHVNSQTGELINIGPGVKKIIGFSPAELYAATNHGIMWYDGAGNWTFLQGTVGRRFIDIGGASGSALYAVSSGDGVSAVYRFNGGAWTRVEGSVLNRNFRETWIDNSGGIYAVATGPAELFYFNGSTWQKLENVPQDNYLNTVWGTGPDNVYLGGSKLYRYDGSNWSEVDTGFTTSSGMMKIWGASPASVYVQRGHEIRHFDGSGWTGIPAVAPYGSDGLCECGEGLYGTYSGKLFLYEGGAWKWVDVPQAAGVSLGSVYNPLEGCLLLTGDLGKLYYYGTALGDISGGGGQQPQVATASIRVEGYSGTILPKTEVTVDAF
ncbi:MAG: hypothetical protein K6T80_07430, partial [Firmicutes bacterium]|nr:hypothetical protein [Bacillota bacterium]